MKLSKLIVPVAAAGAVGYGYLTQVDRDASGAIVGAGNVDAFDIRVGDCFNDSSSGSDEIESVRGVPCANPHDNEVYAVFDLTISEFPGDEAVYELAFDACLDRFEPFVGHDYETSILDIYAIYPTRDGWNSLNDREVVCALYDLEAKKLEGTMKGSRV